ncbi:MAG: hypothetical protein IPH35_06425 [Rhodoferax sp.]|nr:hypothetical protein [Rhodoferax sp.]
MSNILIASIKSIIPGYGNSYGELVSTEEIARRIAHPDPSKGIDPKIIYKMTGVKSVAFTADTINFCRAMWDENLPLSEIFAACQATENEALFSMLKVAISFTIEQASQKYQYEVRKHLLAHIHIFTTKSPKGFEVSEKGTQFGLSFKFDAPIYLQQGCSGIVPALKIAETLLESESDKNAMVLITAENDMLTHAHQRCTKYATMGNLNHWMWPAIFGEGVGAILCGKKTQEKRSKCNPQWHIENMTFSTCENEWRVNHELDIKNKTVNILVRAQEVKKTFLNNILRLVNTAIQDYGDKENIKTICIHESNPNMVRKVIRELGLNINQVPLFSEDVGTLAGVSAFTLLDHAISQCGSTVTEKPITLSVIGEAGGRVTAGNIYLQQWEP